MGRNKLSTNDRLKNIMKKPLDLASLYLAGKHYPLLSYASTIRTKSMRNLIDFQLLLLNNSCSFHVEHSPDELSKITGIGVRRIYDYLKVIHILSSIQEASFMKAKV